MFVIEDSKGFLGTWKSPPSTRFSHRDPVIRSLLGYLLSRFTSPPLCECLRTFILRQVEKV
jgi:hypothetical protein